MKTILRLNTVILLASLLFSGCEKDEAKVTIDGGTPPVLTATPGADVNYANADEQVLALSWTNPDYTFNTGVSSMDVNYNIEIDTVGANFTNPNKKVIGVAKDLTYSFKASDMNDIMQNQLNLAPAVPHTLEIRVVSSLTNNSAQLASNSFQYTATPYVIPPKVTPPVSGELFITGDATEKGWMAGGDAPVASQKFTQLSPTSFEITVTLSSGSYTFVPVYGDWGTKYSIKIKNDPNEVNGGDFQLGGNDILSPGPGSYKINVDFQKGKFTVTKQ